MSSTKSQAAAHFSPLLQIHVFRFTVLGLVVVGNAVEVDSQSNIVSLFVALHGLGEGIDIAQGDTCQAAETGFVGIHG